MLCLNKLRKTYGRLVAVEGLDLLLEPGDIFGFIGPNGAGKTTTIKMISTLIQPTSGTVTLDGIDVARNPLEVRPLLGYMPDSFGVYDDVKVTEYLSFFASAYRIPRSQHAPIIDSVLELTDLTRKKDAFVHTLSRGMQQRLCLAKCLVHDPKLLLLDEPASGLDPRARIEIKELIAKLGRMGKAIIISSHILPELADFCNKIGIIEQGKMLLTGGVDDIMCRLQTGRRLTIKTTGQINGLRPFIEKWPNIGEVVCSGDTAQVEFLGSLEEQADLLQALIADGHKLRSFAESAIDLEDVFMRVTKGTVS